MSIIDKLDGRSTEAAKALNMAFLFDVVNTVLIMIHWFIFWFTNFYSQESNGTTTSAKLEKKSYLWLGLLSWLILGAAATVNTVVEKKLGGTPNKTLYTRATGYALFLIYAIITLYDIIFEINDMSSTTGLWRISVYVLYLCIVVSIVGFVLPLIKGMNKTGDNTVSPSTKI